MRRHPFLSLCFLSLSFAVANALHFYLDANEKRCFIEELPTDTVVEGNVFSSFSCRRFLTTVQVITVPSNGQSPSRHTYLTINLEYTSMSRYTPQGIMYRTRIHLLYSGSRER